MSERITLKTRRRQLLRTLILLAIPTILEHVMSTLLQYVDTAMVGRLGEQATASVSVTTTINWLIGSLTSAVGVAVLALISRAIGSHEEERVKTVAMQMVPVIVAMGILFTAITIGLSPFIPKWMGAEKAIQKKASAYFAIICAPLLFRTITSLCGSALRGCQDTRTPMVVNLFANVLNVGLNGLFIYGLHLGVLGAAYATAISYVISGVLMWIAFRRKAEMHFHWKKFHWNLPILREMFQIGLPVMANSAVSCMGYVVFAGMVSGMGTTIFAAHSIAVTAEEIIYLPGYGLRTATGALVGKHYGARDTDSLKIVERQSIVLTVLMMAVNGALLFAFATPLMRIFTKSEKVISLGAEMLRIVALSEPFFGLMIVLEGILYGFGKTRYPFIVETVSMWGVRILFTFLMVKIWGFGLREVWYCMIADNIFKAILLAVPFLTGQVNRKWIYRKE